MRKVIVSIHTTLDGFISGPTGDIDNLDWVTPRVEATLKPVSDLLHTVDRILLGRVTYEGFTQYWPTATGEFADQMNTTPKIVFSKTLRKVEWGKWANIRKAAQAEQMANDVVTFCLRRRLILNESTGILLLQKGQTDAKGYSWPHNLMTRTSCLPCSYRPLPAKAW